MVDPRHQPRVDLPQDVTIYIFSREEAWGAWLNDQVSRGELTTEQARKFYNEWKAYPEKAALYFSTIGDLQTLMRLARDLGPSESFYVKEYKGKLFLILKGNAKLRTVLNGTRYGVENAKIISMGLGYKGALESIRGGGILTAVLVSLVDVLTEVLSDHPSLTRLIGTLAVDVAKVAIGAAASFAAVSLLYGAAAVGATFALGPLAVAVIVGVAAGVVLDYLDDRFKLKERLTTMLRDLIAVAVKQAAEAKAAVGQVVDDAKEGVLDAAARLAGALLHEVVDEAGRRFVRYVSSRVERLIWFPMPRY